MLDDVIEEFSVQIVAPQVDLLTFFENVETPYLIPYGELQNKFFFIQYMVVAHSSVYIASSFFKSWRCEKVVEHSL